MPSDAAVQLSARPGTMLVVPSSNSTSRLNIGTDTASKVVPVVKYCGLKPSGLPSEQYTSVLAAKLAPAHASSAPATSALRVKPRVFIGGSWEVAGMFRNAASCAERAG